MWEEVPRIKARKAAVEIRACATVIGRHLGKIFAVHLRRQNTSFTSPRRSKVTFAVQLPLHISFHGELDWCQQLVRSIRHRAFFGRRHCLSTTVIFSVVANQKRKRHKRHPRSFLSRCGAARYFVFIYLTACIPQIKRRPLCLWAEDKRRHLRAMRGHRKCRMSLIVT